MSHDGTTEPLVEGDLVSNFARLQIHDLLDWEGCDAPHEVRKVTADSQALVQAPDGSVRYLWESNSDGDPGSCFGDCWDEECEPIQKIEGLRLVGRSSPEHPRYEADWGLDT